MKSIDKNGHMKVSNDIESFLRRCQLKNLSVRTQDYYKEDLNHFCWVMPHIQYVDEITQETLDEFIKNK